MLPAARSGHCRPGGEPGGPYLASRARPARGPRRAARPSAGHTPPRPRRAPAAGPARPRRLPWSRGRRSRCAPLAEAAGPRNRGEITPPMTAQRRGRRQRRRGPRPAARHSQSQPAPGTRRPISGLRATTNRGAPEVGPQLGAAGRGSGGRGRVPAALLRPGLSPGARLAETRAAAPPKSVPARGPVLPGPV